MRKNLIALGAVLALAVPATAGASETTPTASENAAKTCKALRDSMGATLFKQTYGTNKNGSNAFGKCVSKTTRSEKANRDAARAACTTEQTADAAAFNERYGAGKHNKNAFQKCVISKWKAQSTDDVDSTTNAAKQCKAERKADAAAFAQAYGTRRNSFGKCVSAKAKAQQDDRPDA